MTGASAHYRGQQGRKYFAERFTGNLDFGLQYQSRHFAAHCDTANTLLDFGCGDGTILRALPASRRLAVEVNSHCVQEIAEMNAGLAVPIEVGDQIENWEDAIGGVVTSNHALEKVLVPFEILGEVRRLFRPGRSL